MKIICTTLLFAASYFAFGQTDSGSEFLSNISRIVSDSNSHFYYPTLLNKIKVKPDSITKDDLFHLYYGQLVQPGHVRLSFSRNPEQGKFIKLAMEHNCKKLISLGYSILERDPVELTILLHTNICLKAAGQNDIYFLEKRFNLLLKAILSTGDGLTKETAIRIANVEDDRVMKGILKFLGGQELLGTHDGKTFSIWTSNDGRQLFFEDLWTH